MKRQLLQILSVLLTALALGACSSPGFDRKWQAAAHHQAADPYSGRWAGEWRSTRGTHRDQLECVFTKAAPTRYTADFHAHWHGLSSSYQVRMETVQRTDGLHLHGEQDLGTLQGGIYRYDGLVTPQLFRAHYESRYDAGILELKRVPPKPAGAS